LYAKSLECIACGETYDLAEVIYGCRRCGHLLEVRYDTKAITENIEPSVLDSRKIRSMWRYFELLPVDISKAVSLGEGFTPLVKAERISKSIGAKELYLKLDFSCPTGSFKDRGSAILASKAAQLGATKLAIDSSGNAATSLAAYSARINRQCYVFTPSYASTNKLSQASITGAHVIRIRGTRRDVYETTIRACKEFGWYYCGFQTNPFASEGMKTIAFELCEQMEWVAPERIVFPVGTGSGLVGCWNGIRMMLNLGWIREPSSLVCVQPEGCAPIARAYEHGSRKIEGVDHPKTVAEGLMIGHPLKGEMVLRALEESRGVATAVSDDEILDAAKLLARSEGFFVEPSSAASIAGLRSLIEQGRIDQDERIVCILTGAGLKTPETYRALLQPVPEISPSVDELRRLLAGT